MSLAPFGVHVQSRSILVYTLCAFVLAGAFAAVRMSTAVDASSVSSATTTQAERVLERDPGADTYDVASTSAPGLRAPDAFTLVGPHSFSSGIAPRAAEGRVHVVVEIPAGSVDKWEVDKADGTLRWEIRDGAPRKVRYLGYPGNYGMIPRTLLPTEQGGDGDPLDVLVLGPSVPRGSVVQARLVGVLGMLDDGERDDKLIAVLEGTALAEVTDLDALRRAFPGVTQIVETWFANYKGPGEMESLGFADAAAAQAVLRAAAGAFEAASPSE